MNYQISADDLTRLMLLASHMDTDDEIVGILQRVSKSEMERQAAYDPVTNEQAPNGSAAAFPPFTAPVPPAKPE